MRRKIVICVLLFVASFAVRFLVWQNNKIEMATVQSVVTANYLRDANALDAGDIRTFLAGQDPPSNARVIDHPPGYPLIVGTVLAVTDSVEAWRIVQLALNSLAPILLFLIAAALFDEKIGVIAGILAALSPQLVYHSGLLLPDELSVIPILAAIFFLVRAIREPKALNALLCGLFLGASCWLRSNALLLPVFIAIVLLFVIAKGMRLRSAAAVLAMFILTIAPITLRNAYYFDGFIPLSLGSGTTLVEGLGDIDDGTRGLPRTDEDVMRLDTKLDGSGAVYSGLYDVDGAARDRRRLAFGLSAIRSEPLWFARGVAARGLSTFRLERVPTIAPERDERDTTPTVYYWMDRPLKFLQRAFVTATFLPLALIGLGVIAARKQWRELAVILIEPLYYATVQPLVHTEYRYVLATSHMLMVPVGVALCWLVGRVKGIVARD